MIVLTKCPLRVSLAGGSTDLQSYLDKYEVGNVVSFTPDLFTYIFLKKSVTGHYKIVYSQVETVSSPDQIHNDIAREVLSYFKMPPVEVVYTADIPSTGSGLASSSSYLVALIKACLEFRGEEMSQEALGKLAIQLERNFNPLTGYQDIYGCVYSGLKKLTFNKFGLTELVQLPDALFSTYDFYLIPVGTTRSSTDILSTIDIGEVHKMAPLAGLVEKALMEEDYARVGYLVQLGWELKKTTSRGIISTEVTALEDIISKIPSIVARRLIGAGGSGYFLVLSEKQSVMPLAGIKINVCH